MGVAVVSETIHVVEGLKSIMLEMMKSRPLDDLARYPNALR